MGATGDFKLSISKALTDQLHYALRKLESAPLRVAELAAVEQRQGVYQLYLAGDLVYVGSAAGSLRDRLAQHLKKLSGRQNVVAHEVRFTCLYVDEDLTVLAPEDRLIRIFQDQDSCIWNGNGFGLHDPGRNRDSTALRADHFDARYPIRLDWAMNDIKAGTYGVAEFLVRMKRGLPYNFRYQTDPASRSEYASVSVEVPEDGMTAEELFGILARALPDYQITALPGYAIMYREHRSYPRSRVINP